MENCEVTNDMVEIIFNEIAVVQLLIKVDDYVAAVIEPWILSTRAIHFLWSGAFPVVVYRRCSGITGLA